MYIKSDINVRIAEYYTTLNFRLETEANGAADIVYLPSAVVYDLIREGLRVQLLSDVFVLVHVYADDRHVVVCGRQTFQVRRQRFALRAELGVAVDHKDVTTAINQLIKLVKILDRPDIPECWIVCAFATEASHFEASAIVFVLRVVFVLSENMQDRNIQCLLLFSRSS